MAKLQPVFSVSQFNTLVDELLRTELGQVTIKGEVSGFKISQGKWAYFDLKDDASVLNCFAPLFRLDFPLKDGQEVEVTGKPGLYIPSGRYSLTVDSIQLKGEGALQKAFEELKAKLALEGLFDLRHKRQLPRFPESIGIITSREGAALGDIIKVINGRWGGLKLCLAPATVQGKNSVGDLVAGLDFFNQRHPVDVIIFGRGGGSLEDLQAFNAERVARAIFASKIPVVTGVGHEHNVSIADLVADLRAATPSNAAEMAVPDRREIAREIGANATSLDLVVRAKIERTRRAIIEDTHALRLFFGSKITAIRSLVTHVKTNFSTLGLAIATERRRHTAAAIALAKMAEATQSRAKSLVQEYRRLLKVMNPTNILWRGYSITYDASSGKVIASVAKLPPSGRIVTQVRDGKFISAIPTAKQKNLQSVTGNQKLDLQF